VDAIILGEGWEVIPPIDLPIEEVEEQGAKGKKGKGKEKDVAGPEKEWSILQFQYHFLTAFLPFLLRAPADRSIRIITLVSPGWAAALPTLQSKPLKEAPLTISALRGLTTLLVMRHFQLILDTLASAALGKTVPIPNPTEGVKKKREEGVQSNVMSMSVVMPWTRGEVIRGAMGADEGLLGLLLHVHAIRTC
jgi:hypothetical protein